MLDQLAATYRHQVLLVLLFWLSRLVTGSRDGPRRLPLLRRLNKALSHFSPWQLILSTLTFVYAVRHADILLGLTAPEPLARLYSRDYYRATWIVTALDAGFATAMGIKWKWLRDLASLAFSGYYLLFAGEADEKLRKYRAFCTVEMLRVTWEKQSNPYIKFATRRHRPACKIHRKVFLPRPKVSKYSKPITAVLYFNGTDLELAAQHQLVMDLPGGGFICMNPEHHAERILRWARQTGKPVLSFDYGKAPEYPFPFAIDEMYDAYSLLHATKGQCIGMNSSGEKQLQVILTGDSAGANIATAMVVKILETRPPASSPPRKPTSPTRPFNSTRSASSSRPSNPSPSPSRPILLLPVALIFAYPALSFHFTSWMPASDLRVLRSESHPDVAGILRGKEHLEHRAPLSVVEDVERRSSGSERGRPKVLRRKRTTSWGRGLVRGLPGSVSFAALRSAVEGGDESSGNGNGNGAGEAEEEEEVPVTDDREKSLNERVLWWDAGDEKRQKELKEKVMVEAEKLREEIEGKKKGKGLLGETRLAMTSRTAFFNDRIISPPMCRAMALLYIGPRNAPDLHSDYHISPIFTPPNLLAQFPPVFISCGERDPFVDDTVIFAGKLREAKEARKLELLARESRHGESLRMSSGGPSSASRDPLLDESEEDWVQTSIIAGWSHGYLQMVSLLPAAEKVIALMADWIDEAFDEAEQKLQPPPPSPVKVTSLQNTLSPIPASPTRSPAASTRPASPLRPTKIPPPRPSLAAAESSSTLPSSGNPSPGDSRITLSTPGPETPPVAIVTPVDSGAEEENDEDDVLLFTPKRRRGSSNASRTGSPSPVIRPALGTSVGSGSTGSHPRSMLGVSSPVLPSTGTTASSTSTPATGTSSSGAALSSPSGAAASTAEQHHHPLPKHLVTPAERALRDELASLPLPSSTSPSVPSATSHSATTAPHARNFFHASPPTLGTPLSPRPSSALPACYLDAAQHSLPPRSPSLDRHRPASSAAHHHHHRGAQGSKVRAGSHGSLPEPKGAVFVDARDLLRRRRDDVVFGISDSGQGSRDGSGSEDEDGSRGRGRRGRSPSERRDEEGEGEGGAGLGRRSFTADV
ncbi:hypothetical protein JCM8547_003634 [Rhodosporidiobolus lusitaniae]